MVTPFAVRVGVRETMATTGERRRREREAFFDFFLIFFLRPEISREF
jgi:hypothetical protein